MKPTFITIVAVAAIVVFSTCNKDLKDNNTKVVPKDTTSIITHDVTFGRFGEVNYTLDKALAQTVVTSDKPQTISVTDKAGVIWTLEIPWQPLSENVSITMTPIDAFSENSTIESRATDTTRVACRPLSGVVFRPDGYQFTKPAMLTVEFPKSQSVKPLFFSLKGNGVKDTLELVSADIVGAKFKVSVYHFSGTMAGEPTDMQKGYDECKANYDAALAEAAALAKQPITVTAPPAVPINPCTGTVSRSQDAAIKGYTDGICQPEHRIMNQLMAAQKGMCMLSDGINDPNCSDPVNAIALSDRLVKKAQMLINQYGSTDDYYVPVMRTVFKIAYESDLLGGSGGQELLAGIVGNLLKVRENTLKKLREEHDFKVIPLLISLTRDYCMLSPDCDQDTYFETIKKAATFKAHITTEINMTTNTIEVVTQFNPQFQLDETFSKFTSSANLEFISGSIEKGASHAKCGGKYANLIPFNMPLDADLTIEVCEGNDATISFNPVLPLPNGLEMQTGSWWVASPEPGKCETRTDNSAWATAAFNIQASIQTMFDFTTQTLQIKEKDVNKKAILIDKTIPALANPFIISITVKLEHTPL